MKKVFAKIILLIVVSMSFPLSVNSASSNSNIGVFLTVGSGGAVCGNDIVETGEDCDGSSGVPSGYQCNSSCVLEAISIPPGLPPIPIIKGLKIISVLTNPQKEEATVEWKTNKEAYAEFEWGETQEMLDGIIEKVVRKREQNVNLTNLEPDTDYYFRIHARDVFGRKVESPIYKLRTRPLVDEKAPSNIDNFRAEAKKDHILLTWKNPKDPDFMAIKIIRSDEFYPGGIKDGIEVYNDSGEIKQDFDVEVGKRYYYTAFAYDNDANYSSGSIASAVIVLRKDGEVVIEPTEVFPIPVIPLARPEEMIEIDFENFEFLVANKTIKLDHSNGLELLPGTILDVRTKEEFYPRVLKNIIITLTPKDKTKIENAKNYLLRIDKDGKYYSTSLVSPVKIEKYDIHLFFVNFNNSQVADTESLLDVGTFGKVKLFNVMDLLVKPASAEEMDGNNEERIYSAEITLYKYENGDFKKWDANDFSQFNPMLSNQYGQYGFLVPDGRYLLRVRKDNYYRYESLPFDVKNNLVNQDIRLIYYPQINFSRYLVILAVVLIIFWVIKKIIKKIKKGGGFGGVDVYNEI